VAGGLTLGAKVAPLSMSGATLPGPRVGPVVVMVVLVAFLDLGLIYGRNKASASQNSRGVICFNGWIKGVDACDLRVHRISSIGTIMALGRACCARKELALETTMNPRPGSSTEESVYA
jgi:hypothetical protein